MNDKRVNRLLNMAWDSQSPSKAISLARQILAINPDNTDALIILADNRLDDGSLEELENLLLHALRSLDDTKNYNDDEHDLLLLSISYRLAHVYWTEGRVDDAFSSCEKAMRLLEAEDDVDTYLAHSLRELHYRTMIELEQWQKILLLTMKDDTHDLAWAYSRLVAAWVSSQGKSRSVCASMFWDALIISPDVPFYMLGYYDEPDDDEENDAFDFALMYYDIVSVSDDFFRWFTRGTILFGLLTDRFDGREREYVLDAIDSLGGLEEYEKMSGVLFGADDVSVIETLAANKCLSN